MRTRIFYLWDELRGKLWFFPSLFSVAGMLLAVASLVVDRQFEMGTAELLPSIRTTGAAGRTVLGALIGGLVTVVGLAFSMTMLAISQTSSQYGPRLVRTLLDSNVTQYSLGFILGTIVYSMIVLRSIRDLDSPERYFIPHLSILFAELAGACSVISLLVLTNHMMRCLRAETLVAGIYETLRHTIDKLYPEPEPEQPTVDDNIASVEQWQDFNYSVELRSKAAGNLQAINIEGLVELASEHSHRIEILKRPGDFVHEDTLLGRLAIDAGARAPHVPNESERDEDGLYDEYVARFLLGSTRTPRQDIEASVLELVEAGVRALSPGVNDPMTAINIIDYLGSSLAQLCKRKWPGRVLLDANNEPRVRVNTPSYTSVLNAGFDQLRQNAADSVAVHCRLLESLAAIAEVASRPADRAAVARQATMIVQQAERVISEPNDLRDIQERRERVERALT